MGIRKKANLALKTMFFTGVTIYLERKAHQEEEQIRESKSRLETINRLNADMKEASHRCMEAMYRSSPPQGRPRPNESRDNFN
jgi:hypothetical protein